MLSKEQVLGKKDMWETNGVPFTVTAMDALSAMDEYAKGVAIDFNKFKIDNGWIESASRHHFYQPNEETDFLTIEQLFDLYKQSNP